MNEILLRPGFLGTAANFGSDMLLILGLAVAATLTLGVVMAVKGKYQIHRWLQTTAVLLNALLVLWLMISPFREFVAPGVPEKLSEKFYYVTATHGLLGFVTLIFGLFVMLRGNELMIKSLKFNNYKLFMRIAYGLYMTTTLFGVWVYFTWYV